MLTRRTFLFTSLAGAALALTRRDAWGAWGAFASAELSAADAPTLTVYKSASCGCCKKWVEHMKAAGFRVTAHDTEDVAAVKDQFGVPAALRSCHTGLVGGYVLEGHVPADLTKRLLKERPRLLGLAVPGMPMGSPGMEGPRRDRYDVVAFDRAGKTSVYARR